MYVYVKYLELEWPYQLQLLEAGGVASDPKGLYARVKMRFLIGSPSSQPHSVYEYINQQEHPQLPPLR